MKWLFIYGELVLTGIMVWFGGPHHPVLVGLLVPIPLGICWIIYKS